MGTDTQTNVQVDQYQAVVPFDQQFTTLFGALRVHMHENPSDFKVSVGLQSSGRSTGFSRAQTLHHTHSGEHWLHCGTRPVCSAAQYDAGRF